MIKKRHKGTEAQRHKGAEVVFFLSLFLAIEVVFLCQLRAEAQKNLPLNSSESYTSENLRDPFKSSFQLENAETNLNTPELPLPALKAQGIFWGAGFSQAIINDQVVKVGDRVDGVDIIDIEKDFVMVVFQRKQYKISAPTLDNSFDSTLSKQGEANEN